MTSTLRLACAALLSCVAFVPGAYAACKSCGSVVEVKKIEQKGEASGAGAVIGGIAGGVLGHQIGSGRGNTAATVAGAAGGAYAGRQIEKNKNAKTTYQVVVQMEDGTTKHFDYAEPTAFRVGDKVKLSSGKLVRQ